MKIHSVDIGAGVAYVAAGGLASVAGVLSVVNPGHSAVYTASAVAIAAVANFMRLLFNLTPAKGTQAVVTTQDPPTPSSLETAPKV